jgi:HSP90 family molecular chaperone
LQEAIREKGYEVLYACDPLDELTLQAAEKFQDKQLSDVAKDR